MFSAKVAVALIDKVVRKYNLRFDFKENSQYKIKLKT
jgi:hypothetical protein